MILNLSQSFAEPLIVDDFSFPQESDGIDDLRVIDQAQDVVVCDSGFLFRRHIFVEVGDGIAGRLEGGGGKGSAGGGLRPYADGVIHKVGREAAFLNFFQTQIFGQLVYDGADHFQMGQFLGAHRSIGNVPVYQI